MFRSLQMKLMLIMVLLIISLMTVVGAFLMNSAVRFFIDDFYTQVNEVTSRAEFTADLTGATDGETDPVAQMDQILDAYVGELGVDGRNRNYYILDGQTARYLTGSDEEAGQQLSVTRNIAAALTGQVGDESDITTDYMDVAIPFQRGEGRYILYIKDGRSTVTQLNSELFSLILEALVLGLIISILLSYLLSKTMITPIQRLTEGAKRVAAGDFGHQIDVGSRDEIGVLTVNFNSMSDQLENTIAQVENERNKLNTLFLYMADGVVAFNRRGEIIHWNPAAVDLLSRSIDEETSYDDLFGEFIPRPSDEMLEQGGYTEHETRVGERHLSCIVAPLDRAGQGGVLILVHDVTEQRRIEEQRREFVANVSHELRTPLTNIRSYAETLSDNAGDLPPDMERNFLDVILNESDRMTHIVQDLLTLSRFDSGREDLNMVRFSFGKAVRDTYSAVLMEAQRHAHTVTLDMPDGMPEVVGDRERILQVMMNIVSNAIKYTPDGGKIAISAGLREDRVWMEVDDNGIGIPPADRGRIFERFYRVDKARSRESGGTGLGLSIAKEIVDRHEGRLALVDKDEPGLTIRLELKVSGPAGGVVGHV